jgi:hypothetical protein
MAPSWRRRAVRLTLLALAIVLGALTLLVQRAFWRTGEPVYRGFHVPYGTIGGETVRWAREIAKIEVPDADRWRPLAAALRLRPAPGSPDAGTRVVIAIDDVPVRQITVAAGRETYEVAIDSAVRAPDGSLPLQIRSETFDDAGRGVGVVGVTVRPVLEPGRVAWTLGQGAAAGLALWLLVVAMPARGVRDAAAPRAGHPPQRRLTTAICGAGVFLYLLAWAVVKPPLQGPDEHTHMIKALSLPAEPWISPDERVPVSSRLWNPICEPLPQVSRLFAQPQNAFDRGDVAALASVRWPDAAAGTQDRFCQAWTYPPAFYWAALATGGSATRLLGLSPYASLLAWRVAVALLAAAAWAWVFRALWHLPETRAARAWIVALIVANPMLAFVSSSVNPDALHVPLVTLAVVYSLAYTRRAVHGGLVVLALLLAAFTKASGLLAIAAIGCAAAACTLLRCVRPRDLLAWARLGGATAGTAWVTFYAWSPPRLYGPPGAGQAMTPGEFLHEVWRWSWRYWVGYWGRLGWLDYDAGRGWYVALLVVVAGSAIGFAWRAGRVLRASPFSWFAVLFWLAFAAGILLAAFVNVPASGVRLQGRYFLPASIGMAMLLLAGGTWRPALLALLLALNVALFQRSVERYYDGDWSRMLAAQPFARPFSSPPAAASSLGAPAGRTVR